MHGFGALTGAGFPARGVGGLVDLAQEGGDGDFVPVEKGVEVDGDHGHDVEGAQREGHVLGCFSWVAEEARAEVPARLGARGQVAVLRVFLVRV